MKKEGFGGGGSRMLQFHQAQAGDFAVLKSSGRTLNVTIGSGLPSNTSKYYSRSGALVGWLVKGCHLCFLRFPEPSHQRPPQTSHRGGGGGHQAQRGIGSQGGGGKKPAPGGGRPAPGKGRPAPGGGRPPPGGGRPPPSQGGGKTVS